MNKHSQTKINLVYKPHSSCLSINCMELFLVIFFLIGISTGCSTKPIEIASTRTPINQEMLFETLDQKDRPGTTEGYKSANPSIILLTNENDNHLVENLVSENAFGLLQNIDYGKFLCIGVFQGVKPTNGYKVTIEKVVRKENSISIQATLLEPSSDTKKSDIITSPYHLIKIEKGDGLKGSFTINLVVENQEILSTNIEVP